MFYFTCDRCLTHSFILHRAAYVWNEMQECVADQCANTKTEHNVDDVIIDRPVT